MRRRQFIAGLGSAAAWPVVARAQPAIPVIGLLQIGAPSSYSLSGFRQGLKEAGYVEGQNLAVEYRFANDDARRLPALAADLVRRRVRVIVAFSNPLTVQAAKAATSTIPIVFGNGLDPVQQGVVDSLNRPGGNVTGMTSMSGELVSKQFGIFHDLLPKATYVGVLSNPKNAAVHEQFIRGAQAAASAIGCTIEVLTAGTGDEIDSVFMRLTEEKVVQGLLVSNDLLFVARRVQLATLTARYAVPAIYPFREQGEAGGLMSYGPNLADRDREVGHYVGRILKGEKPADLPVLQPTKFELVINLRTSKALGLTIPETLLAIADEVIQ
jgi:putative ABC transport system substrate-binding protein